jgi:hypothetical protein
MIEIKSTTRLSKIGCMPEEYAIPYDNGVCAADGIF